MSVSFASFCCKKDRERFLVNIEEHANSHLYEFDEKIAVFQNCEPKQIPGFHSLTISEQDYPSIFEKVGVKYPDPVLDELTHGRGAPHWWPAHNVNHIVSSQHASSDYIVFADGDCHMKDQPEGGPSWVEVGIGTLENNPEMFVVSPSDGRPDGGPDRMMSQQMFLISRKRFLEMEFIPWDGKFIEGGPFQEFYGLLEGWIYRYMVKNNLYRYVLPPQWRWWHKEWH